MTDETPRFTDRQEAFISWYVKLLNATRAAERAGYQGSETTLSSTADDLLRKPEIRAEIDRRLKASIPSADEVLSLISGTATMDLTPFLQDDLTLDVKALSNAGLGRLVKGVKPGRQGPEVTLRDPDAATKLLARYHRLLDRHLDVDLHTPDADEDTLVGLLAQIATAKEHASKDVDDTQDSTE